MDGKIPIGTVKHVRDHIRALAQSSGLSEKASVADFLHWREAERADEAHKR